LARRTRRTRVIRLLCFIASVWGLAGALAFAGAADQTADVVIKRTLSANFFERPDGSTYAEFYTRAVNFVDASGEWQPIDSTLVADATGWRNAANLFQVHFAADSNSPTLVSLVRGGSRIDVGVVGAESVIPVVAGSTITYPGILPGADLSYTVHSEHVSKAITLHSAPTVPPSFTFQLSVSGLEFESSADVLGFADVNGEGWMLGTPWMADSSGSSGEFSPDVDFSVLPAAAGVYIASIIPDTMWLTDSARVYPVTIDPTFIKSPGTGGGDGYLDTFVQNGGYAGTSQHSNADLRTGTDGAAVPARARTYLKFAVHALEDHLATSATVQVYNYSSSECVAPINDVRTDLVKINGPWEWNITWNDSQPSLDTGNPLATSTLSPGCSGGGNIQFGSTSLAGLVNQWARDAGVNYGVALFGFDGGTTNTWKLFRSADHTANQPKLIVDYTAGSPPPMPSITAPASGEAFNASTVTATWTQAEDLYSGVSNFEYDFKPQGESPVWQNLAGTAVSVESGSLASEGSWTFHIRTKDNVGNWSPIATRDFVIDRTAPVMDSVSITSSSPTNATTVAGSWSATDPGSGVASYEWKFTTDDTNAPSGPVNSTPDTSGQDSTLGEGTWWLWARAIDTAGNTGGWMRSSTSIVIDRTGPVMDSVAITTSSPTKAPTVAGSWSATELPPVIRTPTLSGESRSEGSLDATATSARVSAAGGAARARWRSAGWSDREGSWNLGIVFTALDEAR